MSTFPASEGRDPYLAVVSVRHDIKVAVEVIATVGLEQRRAVVFYNHCYAALIDQPIEEPTATVARCRRDRIWRQREVIEQVQAQVPEVRGRAEDRIHGL